MGEPRQRPSPPHLAKRLDAYLSRPDRRAEPRTLQRSWFISNAHRGRRRRPSTLMKIAAKSEADRGQMADLLTRNAGYGGTIARDARHIDPRRRTSRWPSRSATSRRAGSLEERRYYFAVPPAGREAGSGGASYPGFINNIDKRGVRQLPPRPSGLTIEATGARTPYQGGPTPRAERSRASEWTLDGLPLALQVRRWAVSELRSRGKRAYAAARCIACHRFGGEGGATGPDLTQAAGRFGFKRNGRGHLGPEQGRLGSVQGVRHRNDFGGKDLHRPGGRRRRQERPDDPRSIPRTRPRSSRSPAPTSTR